MTVEEKKSTMRQFERVKELLDKMDVEYEVTMPAFVSFDNQQGACMAFPSQTYDDKLVVVYQKKEWCDTAEDALIACGLMEG